MLSIVICSADEMRVRNIHENISLTVGVEYEIIWVGKGDTSKGICGFYNEGVALAKGTLLCFCHDDILFNTYNWGEEISVLCDNRDIGLVGIAGPVYKSKYPASWVAAPSQYYRVNMIQYMSDHSQIPIRITDDGSYSEVVVLDGCFIAGRKSVFESFKWNDVALRGFHLYDLDISLRVGKIFKNVVANNICITHMSPGNFDRTWLEESEKFHKKWIKELPLNTAAVKPAEFKLLDYHAVCSLVELLLKMESNKIKTLRYWLVAVSKAPFKRKNLMMLKAILQTQSNSGPRFQNG